MVKKSLQILNGFAFGATIFINYLSNSGFMGGKTIGSVSNTIKSLFTPASYAFSIWGFIYVLLLAFVIYQGKSLFTSVKDDSFVEKIGSWFFISCLANSVWVFAWVYEYTGLSCIFIFVLLFSLLKIVLKLQKEDSPKPYCVLVWLPFAVYSGWVAVASIANVSSYLVKINWSGFGLSNQTWTIIMLIIATLINLIVLWIKNIKTFVMVGVWALIAIAVANKGMGNTIENAAYLCAIILFANVVFHFFKQRTIRVD
ncbi:tryptophan-rich sensory protein [Polaribacter sp.]|uniref:tryptophan-rich sensory protein n=1 Tax=Polaribacter sp. TaxID=1920175 RepID=UPI003F696AFA